MMLVTMSAILPGNYWQDEVFIQVRSSMVFKTVSACLFGFCYMRVARQQGSGWRNASTDFYRISYFFQTAAQD